MTGQPSRRQTQRSAATQPGMGPAGDMHWLRTHPQELPFGYQQPAAGTPLQRVPSRIRSRAGQPGVVVAVAEFTAPASGRPASGLAAAGSPVKTRSARKIARSIPVSTIQRAERFRGCDSAPTSAR